MYRRDRLTNLAVLAAAVLVWAAVVVLFLNRSPAGDPPVQVGGALLLGAAVGVSVIPLVWLASFARQRRIAYRGDWSRAVRRGAWAGGLVALFVVLRARDAFALPLAAFLIVLVVIVEVTLSVDR